MISSQSARFFDAKNFQAARCEPVRIKNIPEFITLDANSKCQGKTPSGISIFTLFSKQKSGVILVNLASRSCMNKQYSPRQDGCAYSFASRDQSLQTPDFTGLAATTCHCVTFCQYTEHRLYTVGTPLFNMFSPGFSTGSMTGGSPPFQGSPAI